MIEIRMKEYGRMNMRVYLHMLQSTIENLEKPISTLMYKGFFFSFALCVFATFLLVAYVTSFSEPILFYSGFSLLKSGMFFGALFYIFAIAFDGMAKHVV